jgi:ribosomal protein S18 acetylase RimI-like enzyme
MRVEIVEESAARLLDYGSVSIAFRVERRYRVECVQNGLGGLVLVEEPVGVPYVKDYDSQTGGPQTWSNRWDTSRWGILGAYESTRRIAGAVIAWKTPELVLTGDQAESAVLWDVRVDPEFRRRGVGGQLFRQVADWCRARSCRRLEVETQNTNVPACRFYARHGCELVAVDRHAYRDRAAEVQLVWAVLF